MHTLYDAILVRFQNARQLSAILPISLSVNLKPKWICQEEPRSWRGLSKNSIPID